jgi:hypothetical protein
MLGLLAHGEDYYRRRGDAAAVFEVAEVPPQFQSVRRK